MTVTAATVPMVPATGRLTKILVRSPKATAGAAIVGAFLLLTLVGPWVAPCNPNATVFTPNLHPSGAHWLGTTSLGQDILSQLLDGARATMVVALVAAVIATVLSVLVGVTAGYLGGRADGALTLVNNVFLAIPSLPLLIVVGTYLSEGARSNSLLIGAVISLTGWAYGARALRAQTLSLRNRDFVEAARIVGERRARIIVSELAPNLLPILTSSFLFTVLTSIGTFVALAYIGVTNTAVWNWGTMLYWAQANNAPLVNEWWWWVPPGACIALVGAGFALLNFGLDEVINPRLKAAGLTRKAAKAAGVPRVWRVGLTPVVRRGEQP